MTNDIIFDEKQAADYLKQKPRTIRLWRRTRGLPFYRLTSKVVLFRKSDIDAWLDKCQWLYDEKKLCHLWE